MDKKSRDLQQKIDSKRRLGGPRGRRPVFTEAEKRAIRAQYAANTGCSMRVIAKERGVCVTTIWRVLRAALVVLVVLLLSTNGWASGGRRVLWLDRGPYQVRVIGIMATEQSCRTVARGLNSLEPSDGVFAFVCRHEGFRGQS
jgi:hypothetical protein